MTSGGYVGLSIATLLSQHHKVTAVDIVPEKVELINNKKSPIQDEYIEKYLAEKELDLTATLDAKEAYSDADFVVIAAPTNYDSKKNFFDTSAVEAVIKLVIEYNPEAIMVIKSTIPVGIYNEYIDVCIGELGASFHPVVYLLTKDGVVEYVDVLHCLMFGNALVCQDPIYIANQGVALERSGREVNLRQKDGSVLELAPLTAEWNVQELPSEVTGAFNDMGDNQFDWMDVESGGYFQMGVQDNNIFYQGYAEYLGVVPEGMVLGIFTNETPDGIPGITFVAAMKYELHTNTLSLTILDGPNPFAEGKTQLQMIRCPDTWPQRVPLTAD